MVHHTSSRPKTAAGVKQPPVCVSSTTNALSPLFDLLVERLEPVILRDDWDENNLRVASFEALNAVVEASARDCEPLVCRRLRRLRWRRTSP